MSRFARHRPSICSGQSEHAVWSSQPAPLPTLRVVNIAHVSLGPKNSTRLTVASTASRVVERAETAIAAGRGMLQIIVVLGVSGGIPASRVVRGAVLGVKENVYFQAAQAIGSSRRRSLLRHGLPRGTGGGGG